MNIIKILLIISILHDYPPTSSSVVENKTNCQCIKAKHYLTRQFQYLYIFGVEINPHISMQKIGLRTRILSMLQNQIGRVIIKPIINGMFVYSHSQPRVNQKLFESGEYRILIKLRRVINVKQNPSQLISVLDSFLKNIMIKKGYNLLCKSRKYFDMKKRVQHFAVHKYSGFHVDFVKSQQLFFLRIDSSRKIVCSQTGQDAIQYYFKLCKRDKDQKRRFVKQKLIGRTVMANYGKHRFYKIKDIAFQPLEYERLQDQRPLTEYYQQKYGVQVKNLSQNLIVISNRKMEKQNKKCYLIPELCFMVGFPDDIQESKQKQILNQMKIQPDQTRTQSNELLQIINQDVEEWKNLQKLGISFQGKEMFKMDYKKFPIPVLELGQNLTVQRGLQNFFNMAGRSIYKNFKQIKCTVLYFNRINTDLLIQILQKNSNGIGVKVQITKHDLGQLNNNKAITQIENGIIEAKKKYKSNMLLIIIPNQFKSGYRKIKKFSLIEHKVLTQLVCESMVINNKNNVSIFGKILLQMLAKSGNVLWIPKQVLESSRKIMLLAFQANKAGAETVISTCCTTDETYYVSYSKFGFCAQNNQQSTQMLEVMVKNTLLCLEYYKKKNKVYPDQLILMSRAGTICVKELVLKNKLVYGIRKQLRNFFDKKQFAMTYILLQTKDSTRFFIHQNPYGKARNTQTGTIVDEKIVKNNQFLMITQTSSQMAAAPVKFKILDSDTKLQRVLIEQLLFNQCFGYANFTGLVQTPAILQYAKKCAKFVSQAPFEENLQQWIQQIPYYL